MRSSDRGRRRAAASSPRRAGQADRRGAECKSTGWHNLLPNRRESQASYDHFVPFLFWTAVKWCNKPHGWDDHQDTARKPAFRLA
jgi:hypothetical protein